ncbi:MAG: methylaspartate mutase, partial [Candidatus Neomarinimicrobiota bacterium]
IGAPYEPVQAHLVPGKNLDIGAGKGVSIDTEIYGGVVGILLDGRGRPLELPVDAAERIRKLREWSQAVNEYPKTDA